jgi:hypothetical protein
MAKFCRQVQVLEIAESQEIIYHLIRQDLPASQRRYLFTQPPENS